MVYKTLKKVSDYCQLLDKSKYPATHTKNGITFTNNGDGSITVNGTATSRTALQLVVYEDTVPKNSKFLIICPINDENKNKMRFEMAFRFIDGTERYLPVSTTPFAFTKDIIRAVGYIVVNDGETVNAILAPQLYNLTEMYGAGNEPTTVEQFRQDFPEELYDYKPYCFIKSYKTLLKASDNKIITSYKKSLICTTKNLFDSEDWYNTLHAINSTSMVKETVNGIEYYKFRPSDIFNYEYMKGKFKENTVYTLSCLGMNADGTNNRYTGFQFYYTDGTRSLFYINTGEEQKYTVTTLSNKTVDYIILGYNVNGYVLVRNIQLEEGSTATEYHPYGYL